MGAVNATRGGMNRNVVEATKDARLIGFNGDGEACVWFGGYTLNVYDAARDWKEIRSFTSGEISGLSDKSGDKAKRLAKERMEMDGFRVVE